MDKEIRLGRFDKWGYKNSFSKGELARELTYMNRDYDKLEQQVKKQKEAIDKVIAYIEKEYYSKNTIDIENIGITTNKLIQIRKILKEVSE